MQGQFSSIKLTIYLADCCGLYLCCWWRTYYRLFVFWSNEPLANCQKSFIVFRAWRHQWPLPFCELLRQHFYVKARCLNNSQTLINGLLQRCLGFHNNLTAWSVLHLLLRRIDGSLTVVSRFCGIIALLVVRLSELKTFQEFCKKD